MRHLESHSATSSFDPIHASIASSAAHLFSARAKATMPSTWSSTPSSSPYFLNNQVLGHQDPTGSFRAGLQSRSTNGTLPRNNDIAEQTMGTTSIFVNGQAQPNGGIVRKKRRRYGPKPEPPYTCFCGKVFKRHEHMLRHRATHDDGIKYECHICGKCFRRQDVMHRHTMTHTSRSRLQNKMRTTASSSSTTGTSRRVSDAGKSGAPVRKREQEHVPIGNPGMTSQDVLEDPTLRVGLADYPGTPTSARYNDDHHIAAAQLYRACNGTQYSYPAHSVNIHPVYLGDNMSEAGYTRSDGFSVMTDYHPRMGSAMSPPPPFFASPSGFAQGSFEAEQLGVNMGRSHMSLSNLGAGYEYELKPNVHEGGHYPSSWHGGYGLPQGATHICGPESEWSEPSPSGPSTHTFASPAWSQKAEAIRREGAGSASGGTPTSMASKQLSMDPAARWHSHQQQYQQGSPLIGGEIGLPALYRSPAQEPRRRLSAVRPQDIYHGSGIESGHADKSDPHSNQSGAGLGLFDQSHGNSQGSESLSCFPTPMITHSVVGDVERMSLMQHVSPRVANGTLLSSVSHYPVPETSPTHVSSGADSQYPCLASEGKPGFARSHIGSETLDTGSPLTEATGIASPKDNAYVGNGGGEGHDQMQREETREESQERSIDPHLVGGINRYLSSSSTASAHCGQYVRRW
ncbi:related to b-induced zinc finger protein [Melanopsichium pennsylvanicum]|uniref:Related to b-induced zinc finger protein n=2 Tax=Melanopsichium pennsylvanicum TaxID=63383 RepID=A0AAJ4XLC7_9BASI|nr:related to b-induced zinc finger protein [Melanopsichium pennsylvanicum]